MMRDPVKKFLRKAELEQIETYIREAERTTRGEIVVMVAPASHGYPMAGLLGSAAISLPAAVALTRTVDRLFGPAPTTSGFFWGSSSLCFSSSGKLSCGFPG